MQRMGKNKNQQPHRKTEKRDVRLNTCNGSYKRRDTLSAPKRSKNREYMSQHSKNHSKNLKIDNPRRRYICIKAHDAHKCNRHKTLHKIYCKNGQSGS